MTLISNINLRVLWMDGPDSLHGITQKLKYNIIVTQDIVSVNGLMLYMVILGSFLHNKFGKNGFKVCYEV